MAVPTSSSSLIRLLLLLTISISSLHSTSGVTCFHCKHVSNDKKTDWITEAPVRSVTEGAALPNPGGMLDCSGDRKDWKTWDCGPDALCSVTTMRYKPEDSSTGNKRATVSMVFRGCHTPASVVEAKKVAKVDIGLGVVCTSKKVDDLIPTRHRFEKYRARAAEICLCAGDLCNGCEAKAGEKEDCTGTPEKKETVDGDGDNQGGNGGGGDFRPWPNRHPDRTPSGGTKNKDGGAPSGFRSSSSGMIQLGFLGAVVGWVL